MVHTRADQSVIEGGRQAPPIGILRERLNERLGLAKLFGEADHLLRRQEQQSVLLEERPSPRLQNGAEVILLTG